MENATSKNCDVYLDYLPHIYELGEKKWMLSCIFRMHPFYFFT